MQAVEGRTSDRVWTRAFNLLQTPAAKRREATRGGITRELLHVQLCIRDPIQRWVVSRTPPINPAFAIAEIVWILTGRADSAFVNSWNRQLPRFAGTGSTYHGAYGFRLRHHFGFDQLVRAYEALRHNPATRQVVLQIWDAGADFPTISGEPVDADIPCNICAMIKVRDERLEWMQIVRSNDVVLGLPYNIIQFTTLQEVLAGWLGVQLGGYCQVSDSLHVYERDLARFRCEPAKPERSRDSLACKISDSARYFQELGRNIERLSVSDLARSDVLKVVSDTKLPLAYRNLLCIMAAEAARRNQWSKETELAISLCQNPLLSQVWRAWQYRRDIV